MSVTAPVRLGLRQNAAQFTLLVIVNALVRGVLGSERTVLPLRGQQEFHLSAYFAALSYILAFGLTKLPPTSLPAPCPTGTAANPSYSPAGSWRWPSQR